jgi:hypothetical protein
MLVGPRHLDSVMLVQYRALRLAQETQQIRHRVSGDEAHVGTLFSENLY